MALKPENFLPPTEDEILADLTPDERAAIEEAERDEAAESKAGAADEAEETAEAAEPATETDVKPAGEKPDAPAEKAAEHDKTTDAGAAADAETVEKPAVEAAAKGDEPPIPRQAVPDWQPPENAEAKLKEIGDKRDALAERFDNAEIGAKELLAEQRKLDQQEREIERAQDRAQMAAEMRMSTWEKTVVPLFLKDNAHYRENETLLGLLDAEVRRQQVAAGKAGKDPLDPSILVAADEAIRASLSALGIAPAKDPPAEDPAKVPPAAGKKPSALASAKIPPTLANVPAAEISGTDGKYGALDRLATADPIAFEEAVGKLPEADREAYLSAQ